MTYACTLKKTIYAATLLLAAIATSAHAASCQEDFKTVGDARNGLAFLATRNIPGISVSSALGQMQQAAMNEGYEIGSENILGDQGELFFLQTNLRTPLVLRAGANKVGQVTLDMKLARGQTLSKEDGARELCKMLDTLKAGPEGEAIATAARAKSGTGNVTVGKADQISKDMGRVIKKLSASLNAPTVKDLLLGTHTSAEEKGDVSATLAPISARYLGRSYRIDGQVYTTSRGRDGSAGEIHYLVTPTRGLLKVRQSADYNSLNFGIICQMAPDQAMLFASLGAYDWVTLEGEVDQIDTRQMTLRNCRQAS